MKLTKSQLKEMDDLWMEGYIRVQKHPDLPIYIANYTNNAQIDKMWTKMTMMCRGLIFADDGEIIARPFSKFFNVGESSTPGEPAAPLPNEPFEVYEKVDGSMGILVWINGEPSIATRGSFNSEQAIEGTKIFHEMGLDDGTIDWKFYDGKTCLFEILYPENRIVVNYGDDRKLILLAVIDNETGEDDMEKFDALSGFVPHVKRYDIGSLSELKVPRENAEGYVVRFKGGLRLKYKFDEYVRLHKLVTEVNERRIWEVLSSGDSIDFMLKAVPDEFLQFVTKVSNELHQQYADIMSEAEKCVKKALKTDDRTKQAKIIKKCRYPGVGFAMLDGKDYSKLIWKLIKP